MVASIFILFVLMALVIAALLFFTIGLYTLVEKAKKDIAALNELYDGLEETVSKLYADLGTLGNRLTAIESKFVKGEGKSETKSKSKKQE